MDTITQLHEDLLNLLLEGREENNSIKFWLRTKDSVQSKVSRLKNGYWFTGNHQYLFFSPYKRGDWKNKTKSIGMVFGEEKGELSWKFIELVFPGEENQNRIDLYHSIAEEIEKKLKLKHSAKEETRFTFHFPEEIKSLSETVDYYIKTLKPLFDQKIIEFGEEDAFFITDLQFRKQLQKTLRIRDRLHNLIEIEYPQSFPTYGQFQTNFRNEFEIPDEVTRVNVEFNDYKYENLTLGSEGAGTGRIYFNEKKSSFIEHNPQLNGGEKIKIKVTFETPEIIEKSDSEELTNELPKMKEFPLNQILYGPPGTGKTYNTIRIAAEIIDPNFVIEEGNEEESYEQAKKIYNEALNNQIEFVTFHQNFSYEDFIQGIRPRVKGNNDQLSFEKVDGVFKIIADRALANLVASEKKIEAKSPFEKAFQNFIAPLEEGEENEIEVKMAKVSYYITEVSDTTIRFRKHSGGTGHSLSLSTLAKMYEFENIGDIQGLSVYYKPLLEELLKIGKKENNGKITPLKNYVIIIDEINRANISRVFGELITLIETDKRYGNKNPMKVKLPSGDEFEVPKNLHIIGTMNTADKSIALLDVALRRRFKFVSKYPDANTGGVLWSEEMTKINDEILASGKSRDFLIGHSYFMEEDIIETMNEKVIPLLMEYFMGNEDQVKSILKNAGFILSKKDYPIEIEPVLADEPI